MSGSREGLEARKSFFAIYYFPLHLGSEFVHLTTTTTSQTTPPTQPPITMAIEYEEFGFIDDIIWDKALNEPYNYS
jgi:hypothetical protein